MRFFDKKSNRLIYTESKSDNVYWDNHWDNHWDDDNFASKIKISSNRFISKNTQRYLDKGRILEGGCGRGQNVFRLRPESCG